jgi:hypothetical protein
MVTGVLGENQLRWDLGSTDSTGGELGLNARTQWVQTAPCLILNIPPTLQIQGTLKYLDLLPAYSVSTWHGYERGTLGRTGFKVVDGGGG